jgi:hypothetical protein
VLEVDGEVESHDRQEHGQPVRQGDVVEETPAALPRTIAVPMEASGARNRTARVSRPRLLAQRSGRPVVSRRRGARISNSAISTRTLAKKPSRITDS